MSEGWKPGLGSWSPKEGRPDGLERNRVGVLLFQGRRNSGCPFLSAPWLHPASPDGDSFPAEIVGKEQGGKGELESPIFFFPPLLALGLTFAKRALTWGVTSYPAPSWTFQNQRGMHEKHSGDCPAGPHWISEAEMVRQSTFVQGWDSPPNEPLVAKRGERKLSMEHPMWGGTTTNTHSSKSNSNLDSLSLLSFSCFSGTSQQATPTSSTLLQKVPRPSCLGLSEVLLFRATIKFYLLKHDGLEKKTTHQEPEKPAFISMTTA